MSPSFGLSVSLVNIVAPPGCWVLGSPKHPAQTEELQAGLVPNPSPAGPSRTSGLEGHRQCRACFGIPPSSPLAPSPQLLSVRPVCLSMTQRPPYSGELLSGDSGCVSRRLQLSPHTHHPPTTSQAMSKWHRDPKGQSPHVQGTMLRSALGSRASGPLHPSPKVRPRLGFP